MPPSELRVAVVGAGVVGSCIALALRKRGAAVTLIDSDEPGRGCSYGNSGAISPGSVAPLAMPGILSSVPRMLLDEESPLHLPLSYLPKAAPWLMRFVASAQPSRVALSAAKLAALHAGALDRHEALARELGVPELFMRRGHLHLYPDARALAKDAAGWRMRQHYGYPFTQLDRDGILALEPHVGERYRIGMFMGDHATIVNPFRYVQAMVRAFTARGGRLRREEVRTMTPLEGGCWRLGTAGAAHGAEDCFDHVVVAAGAWSRRLLDPLGVHLALESQRGYHVQFQGGRGTVSRTVVLADRKIFVTPMEEGLRVGGTVEIGGLERPPDPRRGSILERIARETFEGLDGLHATQWMGHRPCMPDSVPVIGPAAGWPGLWLAVGHGHLGLTDSINTAQSIASGLFGARSAAP
ncbi:MULTISPECIES: FAD-dependent oxidoreductase [unclassified Variovorax]|uniref:NAD(P)/FAD-dependent oxidoreductase n=1 Tax=unclassified Variovorax TaxID=663243 RepID=UPI000837F5D6|nr:MULTISPECIES: FAD-dependent oxidoreductase [unclassified Variovorax]PNG52840.1 D-amino acid dehydrogenase 1 [Variovorax sp. B4]PNG55377.1 D-amino acid dehydrogenase 1 [Variovorax sp. B2]VTV09133.1 D-amino acid dehydrogenase small subunit [Variovorax sp. WDL1]